MGQSLSDAHAICGRLVTWPRNLQAETAFLETLCRWAERFSPWVTVDPPDGLFMDMTGCAHLFGGEAEMLVQSEQAAAELGLTVRCGIADTVGAAWALARHATASPGLERSGDAIDQEARATRSRAARRSWSPGGKAPLSFGGGRIAPPGRAHGLLSSLPVAALRLEAEVVEALLRVGLRRVGDLLGQPRAPLARRFGRRLVLRLDQAVGAVPEPISPGGARPRLACRLSLPEPIGTREDMAAALDRLLPRLCALLRDQGRGTRRLCLQVWRVDETVQRIEVGLARASADPARIRPLLMPRLDEIDAGFGVEMLRLEVMHSEPLQSGGCTGHLEATPHTRSRADGGIRLDDLIGRIGGRLGMEALTRRHPADSHLPEKTALVLAAAWSEPTERWPSPTLPRPLMLWRPEPVLAPAQPHPPATFRWRNRRHALAQALGPERIAPEWWLDDPEWRSGVRDYWQVITQAGEKLWLFHAHGAAKSGGWFCQGKFA